MRRVHREATEHVGANRLGRNGMRGRVHREGLDGTGDGNEAWRTAERRKRPCVRSATVETGSCSSGGVWRTAKRRKRTSYGRNGGPVDREGCGVPQNGGNGPPTVETGVLFIGRGVAYRKTGLHGILFISTVDLLQPPRATVHPPSTSSSLHLRLFIHGLLFIQPPPRATPPATVQPALSTGSCSTTPPWATVHPALHRLLFIQPSTGSSCSSSPPRGPVHPAPTGSIDRGPVHPEATPRGPVHPPPPGTVHPNPPSNAHCSSRGSIDRLQLAAVAKESLDRVQLTAIDRSLGFSNA